jgi:hypothetical protein
VLRASVVVPQPVRLFSGILQQALAGNAEWDLSRVRDPIVAREATEDVAAKIIEGATGPGEDSAGKSLAFVQYPKEDVLRLDGAGSELAVFGASVEEDLKRS